MATQAFVEELADAMIDSFIQRLTLRANKAANRGTSFAAPYVQEWNFLSKVEFVSAAEWAVLKRALKTEDSDEVIARIKSRNLYREELALKYRFMAMNIVADRQEHGRFCIIETKERG